MKRSALTEGRVRINSAAPEFSYPVYLVYSGDRNPSLLQKALETLLRVVNDEAKRALGIHA